MRCVLTYENRYENIFDSIERRINILNQRTDHNKKLKVALTRQDNAYKRFNKSYAKMWQRH